MAFQSSSNLNFDYVVTIMLLCFHRTKNRLWISTQSLSGAALWKRSGRAFQAASVTDLHDLACTCGDGCQQLRALSLLPSTLLVDGISEFLQLELWLRGDHHAFVFPSNQKSVVDLNSKPFRRCTMKKKWQSVSSSISDRFAYIYIYIYIHIPTLVFEELYSFPGKHWFFKHWWLRLPVAVFPDLSFAKSWVFRPIEVMTYSPIRGKVMGSGYGGWSYAYRSSCCNCRYIIVLPT